MPFPYKYPLNTFLCRFLLDIFVKTFSIDIETKFLFVYLNQKIVDEFWPR